MKLFQDSLMTLPIRFLKLFSKDMRKYYAGGNNSSDAYEHFYTGFIATILLADLQRYFDYAWIGIVVAWLLHYVVKEVIVDGLNKHWIKKLRGSLVSNAEMMSFKIDTITRNAGFVFALPYLYFVMR